MSLYIHPLLLLHYARLFACLAGGVLLLPPALFLITIHAMARPSFQIPPPPTDFARLSFPNPHTLLVTLSRPKSLNCINSAGNQELHAVWTWLDAEPSLRVGIVTGEGRAFCAGADLKGQ